jgi:NADH-quinone oxidoreductase subunit L
MATMTTPMSTTTMPCHAHAHDDHCTTAHGHGHHTPHESPLVHAGAAVILSLGALAAGFVFVDKFVGDGQTSSGAVPSERTHQPGARARPPRPDLGALGASGGVGSSALRPRSMSTCQRGLGARLAARKGSAGPSSTTSGSSTSSTRPPSCAGPSLLGDLFWKGGDQKIIDGLGPDGVSAVSAALGRRTGSAQTGYVYHYAFVMLLGVAGLLTFALWAWRA